MTMVWVSLMGVVPCKPNLTWWYLGRMQWNLTIPDFQKCIKLFENFLKILPNALENQWQRVFTHTGSMWNKGILRIDCIRSQASPGKIWLQWDHPIRLTRTMTFLSSWISFYSYSRLLPLVVWVHLKIIASVKNQNNMLTAFSNWHLKAELLS